MNQIVEIEKKREDEIKQKKEDIKNLFKVLKEQNDLKIHKHQEDKQHAKEEDKKYIQNYTLLLEKQENDRNMERMKRINNVHRIVENQQNPIAYLNRSLLYEDKLNQKLIREKKELDER